MVAKKKVSYFGYRKYANLLFTVPWNHKTMSNLLTYAVNDFQYRMTLICRKICPRKYLLFSI